MQGHDIDRVKHEDGTYTCQCAHCGKDFEAKRDDASFCSPAHRTAFHRRKEKMLSRLHALDDLSTWAGPIAKMFPDNETYKMLCVIAQRVINAANDM